MCQPLSAAAAAAAAAVSRAPSKMDAQSHSLDALQEMPSASARRYAGDAPPSSSQHDRQQPARSRRPATQAAAQAQAQGGESETQSAVERELESLRSTPSAQMVRPGTDECVCLTGSKSMCEAGCGLEP